MSKELKVSVGKKGKKFKISAIENGTVIDRIPSGMSLKVFEILELKELDQVMIGMNFSSEKIGKKDVLKVENYFPSQEQIDKLAILCHNTKSPMTVSTIKKGVKQSKLYVELPSKINNVIKCFNPKCITNLEGHTVLNKTFYIIKTDPLQVKCHYCERKMKEKEIELL